MIVLNDNVEDELSKELKIFLKKQFDSLIDDNKVVDMVESVLRDKKLLTVVYQKDLSATLESEKDSLFDNPYELFLSKLEDINFETERKFGYSMVYEPNAAKNNNELTFIVKPILNEISESVCYCGILETSINNAPNVTPHFHYYYMNEAGNGQSSLPNTGYAHTHLLSNAKVGDIFEDSDHDHKIGKINTFGDESKSYEFGSHMQKV